MLCASCRDAGDIEVENAEVANVEAESVEVEEIESGVISCEVVVVAVVVALDGGKYLGAGRFKIPIPRFSNCSNGSDPED